jgi:hypothetical protein
MSAAAGLRDMKKLLMPSANARDHFITEMQNFLALLALRDWHSLAQRGHNVNEDPPSRRPASKSRIMLSKCGKAIAVGLMPLLIIHIYELSSERIDNPMREYAVLFSLLWLVTYLASAVDPMWKDRLTVYRDLLSIVKTDSNNSQH